MKEKKARPLGVLAYKNVAIFVLCVTFALPLATVHAGPPFVTDDPFPLPTHSGEFYFFVTGTHADDDTTLDAAPGIEVNYSYFQNTFFHMVIPMVFDKPSGEQSVYGLGDVELGFKWRFIEQSRLRPDIGIFPLIELPIGDQARGLGNGQPQVYLPIWLGKNWGPWTAYGGGGYWINPGTGNRNWWFTGMVMQRQINDRIYLGAEIFHQTSDTVESSPSSGFNIGGGFIVGGPYQLLFSAGRNIQDTSSNRFSFYVALYRTF